MTRKLLLAHRRAPGDCLMVTALVRDIKLQHPDWQVGFDGPYRDLWLHNPHVTEAKQLRTGGGDYILLSYGKEIGLVGKGQPIHFVSSFHHDLERQRGIRTTLHYPHPDLHLSPHEADRPLDGLPDRYWVVLAGGKSDFTAKWPRLAAVQQSVSILNAMGVRFVQAGSEDRGPPKHNHPRLADVSVDLVGKTTLRELIVLIAHADGVLCPVTLSMHLAAGLGRPCVVMAGSREEVVWEAYWRQNPGLGPNASLLKHDHRYLHAGGELDCTKKVNACWRSKVLQAEDPGKRNHCSQPRPTPEGQWVPECQERITTERIVESVLSYYLTGELEAV